MNFNLGKILFQCLVQNEFDAEQQRYGQSHLKGKWKNIEFKMVPTAYHNNSNVKKNIKSQYLSDPVSILEIFYVGKYWAQQL